MNFFISSASTSVQEFQTDLHLKGRTEIIDFCAYWFVFPTRSSIKLSVKSRLKKNIGLAPSGSSILIPACSLNGKSLMLGFHISKGLHRFRLKSQHLVDRYSHWINYY